MKSGLEKMTQKCIQPVMKENLLLLKDFIGTLKNKFYKYDFNIKKSVY